MSVGTASKLDTEKFRKVHSLMSGGATSGERSAARARAEVMAAKAGLTLKQAVSNLDSKPKAKLANFFDGFEDWCEEREPGYKAKEAVKRAERNARDAVRRAEILKQYGSEQVLFARTEREAALLNAISPLVTKWVFWTDDDGIEHQYAERIEGEVPDFYRVEKISPAVREAVVSAYAWPSRLDDVLREVQEWDRLRWDRGLMTATDYSTGEWQHYAEVEARITMLEHALMEGQPATSWEDVEARFAWKRYEFSRQWIDPQEPDDPFMARVEADIASLRASGVSPNLGTPPSPPVQPRHRTTAEKRAAVLSMLAAHPERSNREIARRLGVSPSTVGTWRSKR